MTVKGQYEMNPMHFYSTLAGLYDKIYHFVDYPAQVAFFVKLVGRYGQSGGRRVLDLACGSGTHMELLHRRGYDVTGADISAEMLAVARKKLPTATLFCADLRNFDAGTGYDLVLCFFNSILYSHPTAALHETLRRMFAALAPGGIAVFDAVDRKIGMGSTPQNFPYEEPGLKLVFSPQWIYRGEGDTLDLHVHFTIDRNGMHEEYDDWHVLTAISIDELCEVMSGIGFSVDCLSRRFDEMTPWSAGDSRVVVVGRRPL